MTTTRSFIAQAIEAILADDNDRAIGLLLRANLALEAEARPYRKSDTSVATRRTDDLPEMRPLKTKPVRARSVNCPVCGAKRGKPCVKVSARGAKGNEVGEELRGKNSHKKRIAKAKEMTEVKEMARTRRER